jgi:hypothetical protein
VAPVIGRPPAKSKSLNQRKHGAGQQLMSINAGWAPFEPSFLCRIIVGRMRRRINLDSLRAR